MLLKHILLFIGLGFTNPVVPDMGTQFATAAAIGAILPQVIVSPINTFLLSIPILNRGIQWFEDRLEGHERLKTAFPRLLAGYFFTYLIGGICLGIYFLLF